MKVSFAGLCEGLPRYGLRKEKAKRRSTYPDSAFLGEIGMVISPMSSLIFALILWNLYCASCLMQGD